MAVQPPASMSKIRAEFGANGRLSQYRRGGGVVPDHANTAPVGTGNLRVSMFNGTSRDPPAPSLHVNLQDDSSSDFQPEGSQFEAWADYRFDVNGYTYSGGSSTGTRLSYQWLTAGNANDLEFYAQYTYVNGSPVGPSGRWFGINEARWYLPTRRGGGAELGIAVQVRLRATGQVLGSANIGLSAWNGQLG